MTSIHTDQCTPVCVLAQRTAGMYKAEICRNQSDPTWQLAVRRLCPTSLRYQPVMTIPFAERQLIIGLLEGIGDGVVEAQRMLSVQSKFMPQRKVAA